MNKRLISILLSLIIVMSSLVSCNDKKNSKVVTADTPYYSVVIGSSNREKNAYMNLDIEFPKITYSNNDGSELIDPINAEIENELSALVETAKENALATYETYLTSAKDNAKKDIEDRIANLEKKYDGIIDKDGTELLADLKERINDAYNNPQTPFSWFNMATTSEAGFPRFNGWQMPDGEFGRNFRQNRDNMPDRNAAPKRDGNNDKVNGFTGTEDVVIPGLHNKNIIVIETTAMSEKETTASNMSGRPSFGNFGNGERPNRASWSNGMPSMPDGFKPNGSQKAVMPEETTKTETKAVTETTKAETKAKETKPDKKPEKPIVASESEAAPLTLDDFYAEYRRLERMRIPDDFTLTNQYIPTTINCGFQVKCLDEDYLSLFVELTESRTTSTVKRLFYNIDLNDKKIVNIKDILGDKYKETCISNINTAIEKWSDEQKATLLNNYSLDNYINENTPFFINNNHKPVIQIEKFVITIGSAGYHEFQIP